MLYKPPRPSELPLAPVWRSLGRHNIGVDHFCDKTGWRFTVQTLVRKGDFYERRTIADITGDDDIDVILSALSVLPGIGVRLALLGVLL